MGLFNGILKKAQEKKTGMEGVSKVEYAKPQEKQPGSSPIGPKNIENAAEGQKIPAKGLGEAIGLLMEPKRRAILAAYCFPNSPATVKAKLGLFGDRVRKHTAILNKAGLIQRMERAKALTRANKQSSYQPYQATELGRAALKAVGEE